MSELCPDCNQPNTYYVENINESWCRNCNSKRFQRNFKKWTSGNKLIDNFIQDVQLKAEKHYDVIEWIPYNRIRNIQYLAKGGFSTIYKAIWLDGHIEEWDRKKRRWVRFSPELDCEDYEIAKQGNVKSPLKKYEKNGRCVVLKSLNNSSNIREDFLNEVIYVLSLRYKPLLII